MAMWQKAFIGLLVTAIAILVGCIVLVVHMFSDMCTTAVIDQSASPSGKLKAVLFQIDCGATTDFNSHVIIIPNDNELLQKDSFSKSVFAVDRDNGRAPAGNGGGPEVRLHWTSDSRLEIQYHRLARLIRATSSSNGVMIDYRTFR